MEVYRIPSKKIQDIVFANATYEAVIEGLNGYFASEPRNNYITVKMESDGIKQDFALYEPEAWADILIEWLRKKHDIFYRPGMTLDQVEAARSVAKMCDLRAPSRYFSDEACIEYLFSLINSKQKDRSFTILQDLYRDIFKRQPGGLSAEDIANKILDRVLETEDLLHKSVDSVNKECKATGKLMVEDYKLKLKDYILKDIKKHGYRYDGLETKSPQEIVDWIIEMATCPRDGWAKDEIENLRGQISRLKDLINAMNEEVGDM